MLAFTIGNTSITMIIDGMSYAVTRSTPVGQQVLDELHSADPDKHVLVQLLSTKAAFTRYSDSEMEITGDNKVLRNGIELPACLADTVIACFESGVPYQYLLNLFDRLNKNPSKTSVEELYPFLEHKGMPITPAGMFLAYKGVREDLFSVRGGDNSKVIEGSYNAEGHIFNGVGEPIRVQRNYVEDDRSIGCASGLHVGSFDYASSWGPTVVIVEVDPADVVSVPSDCGFQKLRTCAYRVVALSQGRLINGGVTNAANPYSSSIGWSDPEPDAEVEINDEDAESVGYTQGALDDVDHDDRKDYKELLILMEKHNLDSSDSDEISEFMNGYHRGYDD